MEFRLDGESPRLQRSVRIEVDLLSRAFEVLQSRRHAVFGRRNERHVPQGGRRLVPVAGLGRGFDRQAVVAAC
jgi:hypothetical protein